MTNKDYVKIPDLPPLPIDRDREVRTNAADPIHAEHPTALRARALDVAVSTLPENAAIEEILAAARYIATGEIRGGDA